MDTTLALLPLDNRPPTFWFPQQIARIAGINLRVPPKSMLGYFLKAGDRPALVEWMRQAVVGADALVVATDQLAYGGLIAARRASIPLEEAQGFTSVLPKLREEHPGLWMGAANGIMRISLTASNAAAAVIYLNIIRFSEVEYLVKVLGKEEFRSELEALEIAIPPEALEEYRTARRRNHTINKLMLSYQAEGVLDEALLLQEDASPYGPHVLEQQALRRYAQELGIKPRIYPGVDEGTQTLLASWINRQNPPLFEVRFTSHEGAAQIAPFEDCPIHETVSGQLEAAGLPRLQEGQTPDLIFFVHTPCEPSELQAAVDELDQLTRGSIPVALADVNVPNGSDGVLMEELCVRGILPRLAVYSGWNTAGNTLGTAVAAASAWISALRRGPAPEQKQAQQAFLWERIVDDWGYQRLLRQEIEPVLEKQGLDHLNLGESKEVGDRLVKAGLHKWADETWRRGGFPGGPPPLSIQLPWPRTFEVEVIAHAWADE